MGDVSKVYLVEKYKDANNVVSKYCGNYEEAVDLANKLNENGNNAIVVIYVRLGNGSYQSVHEINVNWQ